MLHSASHVPSSLLMVCGTKPTGFILVHLCAASLLDGRRIVRKHSVLPQPWIGHCVTQRRPWRVSRLCMAVVYAASNQLKGVYVHG